MLRVNVVVADPRIPGGAKNDAGYRPSVEPRSMTEESEGLTERQQACRPSLNCPTLLPAACQPNAVTQLVPIG